MSRKLVRAVLTVSALMAMGPELGAQEQNQRNVNPIVFGATYGQWAAQWWKWAFAGPDGQNAVQDETGDLCDLNQPKGKVWFLAGSFGVADVTRTCTIPKNRALFYPLVNSVWIDCPGTADETTPDDVVRSILARLTDAGDNACQLRSTLDGVDVSSLQILTVRTQSPNFTITLPEINIASAFCDPALPAGETGRAIAEGYWVMLPPLAPGRHTLTLHGAGCVPTTPPDESSLSRRFETSVTYDLIVQ